MSDIGLLYCRNCEVVFEEDEVREIEESDSQSRYECTECGETNFAIQPGDSPQEPPEEPPEGGGRREGPTPHQRPEARRRQKREANIRSMERR